MSRICAQGKPTQAESPVKVIQPELVGLCFLFMGEVQHRRNRKKMSQRKRSKTKTADPQQLTAGQRSKHFRATCTVTLSDDSPGGPV